MSTAIFMHTDGIKDEITSLIRRDVQGNYVLKICKNFDDELFLFVSREQLEILSDVINNFLQKEETTA